MSGSGDARRGAAAHVVVGDLDAPELDADDHHHLSRVLRLRAGEVVTATDGQGAWRPTHWTGAGLEIAGPTMVEVPSRPVLTVGFVVAKGDRPERVVRALTELGIDVLVPLSSARGVVRWEGERARRHHQRLRRIVVEAVMQSRGAWVPQLAPLTAAADVVGPGVALADPDGEPLSLATPTVLVGPEGGWEPAERSARPSVSLGGAVLRAETAAIAAGVLLADLRRRAVSDL